MRGECRKIDPPVTKPRKPESGAHNGTSSPKLTVASRF